MSCRIACEETCQGAIFSANAIVRALRALFLVAILTLVACGGESSIPAAPTQSLGYAGDWIGTTLQGDAIGFTVSVEQKVTEIRIDYRLNGCSGMKFIPGLAIEIVRITRPPGNPSVGPFDNPGFGYASAATADRDIISVSGAFTSNDTATGVTTFVEFVGCGSGVAPWSARRR